MPLLHLLCKLQIGTLCNTEGGLMLIPGRRFRLIENLNVSRSYATGTQSSLCLIESLLGDSVCEVCVCAHLLHIFCSEKNISQLAYHFLRMLHSQSWARYHPHAVWDELMGDVFFNLQLWKMDPSQAPTGSSSSISTGELLMTGALNTLWPGLSILPR